MLGAMHGDRVQIAPLKGASRGASGDSRGPRQGNRPTARVVSVLSRAVTSLTGTFERLDPFGVVIPDDPRISYDVFVSLDQAPDLMEGQTVRVVIDTYPSRYEAAFGHVVEVLEAQPRFAFDVNRIISEHNLPASFSEEALREAASLAEGWGEVSCDGQRRDLRQRTIFTIDPDDAKDFDDALSVEPLAKGWKLGVHIADVAHFVKLGSCLDREAQTRSTSVYLADRVIPMLPEALCNGVCSLQEGVDRFCMTVDICLDGDFQVTSYEMYPSVICSSKRLTYNQVQRYFDAEDRLADRECQASVCEDRASASERNSAREAHTAAVASDGSDLPQEIRQALLALRQISRGLQRQARRRGSVQLVSKEAKVVLDDEGKPCDVKIRVATDATKLVEEAMILANQCVAKYLEERGVPCMYRVHEAPDPGKLTDLLQELRDLGFADDVDTARFVEGVHHELQKVVDAQRDETLGEIVSGMLLRSMKRAVYKESCLGHYALGLQEYCHFTSPIRRYPDLLVHRALKACLAGEPVATSTAQMASLADHCSVAEREADKAASESQRMKLMEYLSERIGEMEWGTIVRVTDAGAYVELPCTVVGLASPCTEGGESFTCFMSRQVLVGDVSGKVLRLGQKVLVRIAEVNGFTQRLSLDLLSVR